MKSEKTRLRQKARSAAESDGLAWGTLVKSAKQMIVFGSQACGLQLPDSDFDLLCIGKGKPVKSKRIHVIWVGKKRFEDPKWLGSELATHISKYGIWIKGRKPWSEELKPDDNAAERKRQRITARADALLAEWKNLLPIFRRKQIVRLRRDLQRLEHLKRKEPMMPTRCLDTEWRQMPQGQKGWKFLLKNEGRLKSKVVRIPTKPI
jgi:predicted nucleotidyltransferase